MTTRLGERAPEPVPLARPGRFFRPDPVYRAVIVVFRAVFGLLGLRFTVRGMDNVPRTGPAVLASNHTGYLDFTFVGLAASDSGRLVRFMAKKSVFDSAAAGWAMRAMRHIPVDRSFGASAYRKAIRAIEAGEVVGVFPEATISRAFVLKDFKRGAAALALREDVPLLPVIVWGGHRVLSVDGQRTLRRGIPVTITVGAPIPIRPGASIEEVNADLRAAMSDLLDTAQRSYPDPPATGADGRPAAVWWMPHHLGGSAPTRAVAELIDAERIR